MMPPERINPFSFRGCIAWKHFWVSIGVAFLGIVFADASMTAFGRIQLEPEYRLSASLVATMIFLPIHGSAFWVIAASIVKLTRGWAFATSGNGSGAEASGVALEVGCTGGNLTAS
jgi:hypothetical protein